MLKRIFSFGRSLTCSRPLPAVDFARPPVAPSPASQLRHPPPATQPCRPAPAPAPAVLHGLEPGPIAAAAAGLVASAGPQAWRRSAATAELAAVTRAPHMFATAAISVTKAVTGGGSASAWLFVGHPAQVTRQPQFATQRNSKGKEPKRAALCASPSPPSLLPRTLRTRTAMVMLQTMKICLGP